MKPSLRLPAALFAAALISATATPGQEPKTRGRPLQGQTKGDGKPLLSEDFESTRAGQIPRDFTKEGEVAVTDETAHTGKKSLRMEPAKNGPRRIIRTGGEVTRLGASHWGRLYLKVKLPAPVPVVPPGQNFAVIHSTIVEGTATSPLHKDPILIRLADTCTGPEGTVQYLYNVQPKQRPEFGKGTEFEYKFKDEWMLVEWFVDHATQTYRLFIGGREIRGAGIEKGAGKFEGAEIPEVFESLAFGWNNYQDAGAGFTAWIDDIAVGRERIGALR